MEGKNNNNPFLSPFKLNFVIQSVACCVPNDCWLPPPPPTEGGSGIRLMTGQIGCPWGLLPIQNMRRPASIACLSRIFGIQTSGWDQNGTTNTWGNTGGRWRGRCPRGGEEPGTRLLLRLRRLQSASWETGAGWTPWLEVGTQKLAKEPESCWVGVFGLKFLQQICKSHFGHF